MDVFDAIKTRKSVRAYMDKPVENEILEMLFEAVRLAPSASNRQEWRFVAVRSAAARKELAMVAGSQKFVGEAPVVIAACAETDEHAMPCGQMSYPIDVAIAVDHLTLAAAALGLGTCWIGDFDEDRVRILLDIPENVRVVALLPLGYPANPAVKEKRRLPLTQILKYEHW